MHVHTKEIKHMLHHLPTYWFNWVVVCWCRTDFCPISLVYDFQYYLIILPIYWSDKFLLLVFSNTTKFKIILLIYPLAFSIYWSDQYLLLGFNISSLIEDIINRWVVL